MRLVTAAYSNNWFSNTERFKRGLQIMMIRAHRPLILSAGRIMLLSLDTFVQVCIFLSRHFVKTKFIHSHYKNLNLNDDIVFLVIEPLKSICTI